MADPQQVIPLSAVSHSWFHCSSCGAFYRGNAVYDSRRTCAQCHELAESEPVSEAPLRESKGGLGLSRSGAVVAGKSASSVSEQHGSARPSSRKKKGAHAAQLWAMMGGMCVLVLGGVVVWLRSTRTGQQQAVQNDVAGEIARQADQREQRDWLMKVLPTCNAVLQEFYQKQTAAERAQLVYRPVEQVAVMERFYSANAPYRPEGEVKLLHAARLNVPGRNALEVLMGYADGKKVEVVYLNDGGEWRIDWKEYIRYSDAPFSMFMAGAGDEEGEFRLWVRERVGDGSIRDPKNLSVAFVAPVFGSLDGRSGASSEVLVPRESEAGQRLSRIFAAQKAKQNIFGAQLPSTDPQGLSRVRAKIRRVADAEGKLHLEVKEILAAHWMSVEEDGIPPLASTTAQ